MSVVIPVLDEEGSIRELHARLSAVATSAGESGAFDLEMLFVDDGSTDRSLELIEDVAAGDPRVKVLSLSRNFGQEAACAAGLDWASGDAVVIMDADLQDPPEVIPRLVEAWMGGRDVVHAKRRSRCGDPAAKRALAWLFYRALRAGSDAPIVADAGGFRLLSRQVIDSIRSARDRGRFLRGLAAWVGGRQETVEFDREPRFSGRTKYGTGRQVGLALDAVTSMSALPVRIVGAAGCALSIAGVAAAIVLVALAMAGTHLPLAQALLGAGITLLSGLVMASLGVVGEYAYRLGREARGLPLYVVRRAVGFSPAAGDPAARRPDRAGPDRAPS